MGVIVEWENQQRPKFVVDCQVALLPIHNCSVNSLLTGREFTMLLHQNPFDALEIAEGHT